MTFQVYSGAFGSSQEGHSWITGPFLKVSGSFREILCVFQGDSEGSKGIPEGFIGFHRHFWGVSSSFREVSGGFRSVTEGLRRFQG